MGNSNIVRVPSKNFTQVDILRKGINEILKNDDYINMKEINDYFSEICDRRIIWGGDNAIILCVNQK